MITMPAVALRQADHPGVTLALTPGYLPSLVVLFCLVLLFLDPAGCRVRIMTIVVPSS